VAKEEAYREKGIKGACDRVQQGRFSSVRKATKAYGVHYSTKRRCLNDAKAQKSAHVHMPGHEPARHVSRQARVFPATRLDPARLVPRHTCATTTLDASRREAIVRCMVRLKEFGFSPRHVKEDIMILWYPELGLEEEALEAYFEGGIGISYWIRFLDQYPELVSKLSRNFNKRHIKQSYPGVIQHHCTKV